MRNFAICSLVLIGTFGTAFVPWQPLDPSAQAGYVPEPSVALMLAVAAFPLLLLRRRARR